MEISINKYIIIYNELLMEVEAQIHILFSFKVESVDSGIKYLGYFMKPNDYRIVDWLWWCKKVEAMISF